MTQSTTADPKSVVVLFPEAICDEEIQRTHQVVLPVLDWLNAAEAEIVALRALLARLVDPDIKAWIDDERLQCQYCEVRYDRPHGSSCPVREAQERLAAP